MRKGAAGCPQSAACGLDVVVASHVPVGEEGVAHPAWVDILHGPVEFAETATGDTALATGALVVVVAAGSVDEVVAAILDTETAGGGTAIGVDCGPDSPAQDGGENRGAVAAAAAAADKEGHSHPEPRKSDCCCRARTIHSTLHSVLPRRTHWSGKSACSAVETPATAATSTPDLAPPPPLLCKAKIFFPSRFFAHNWRVVPPPFSVVFPSHPSSCSASVDSETRSEWSARADQSALPARW